MTNLSGFYFDQYAFNYLAQFILALVMALYLLRIAQKTQTTWLLAFGFIAMLLHAGVALLAATSVWIRYFYATLLQNIALFAVLTLMGQFAYRFPHVPDESAASSRRRESQLVLIFSILMIVGLVGWAVHQVVQLHQGSRTGSGLIVVNIGLIILASWIGLTFWRRSFALSALHHPELIWRQHAFNPRYPAARQAFAYAVLGVVPVGLACFAALATMMGSPTWIQDFILAPGVLVALFLFALLYFNYATERTTFVVRLVGITLVIVLLILGMVGVVITPTYQASIQSDPSIIQPQTFGFEPHGAGGYEVRPYSIQLDPDWGEPVTEANFVLPFEFTFYERAWSEILLPVVGVVGFGSWSDAGYAYNFQPAIAAARYKGQPEAQTYAKAQADKVTITWRITTPASTVMQVVLYSDNHFDLSYQFMESADISRMGIQSGSGGTSFQAFDPNVITGPTRVSGDGLLTDFTILERQALNEFMLPLVYLLVLISFVIVTGLPLVFRFILVQPLNNLVAGVQAVERGDLHWQVPVQTHDEIGLVTQAFNKMAASVYEAEQHLEAQVAARTQELAESEQRFKSLAQAAYEVVIIHEQGYILDINQAVTRLFAYTPDELIGRHVNVLLSLDDQHRVWQQVQSETDESAALAYEVQGIAKDGRLIPVDMRVKQVPHQGKSAQVIVMRDLRRRKQLESQRQHLAVLEERERIGRELHDDLGQMMAYVHVQSQAALSRLAQKETTKIETILTELVNVAREAHNNMRQYILGVRTDSQKELKGFWVALEHYLDQLRARHEIEVQTVISPGLKTSVRLAPEVEMQLLRIIQEGLANVVKHTDVARVHLSLTADEKSLQVVLTDDGRGFDVSVIDEPREKGHFGLKIMQERAEMVNGAFQIKSRPGQGTQLLIQMPRLLTTETTPEAERYPWRVLLVDDHPLFLSGLRNMLAAHGVQVVGVAHSGPEAEECVEKLEPDLIFMDIHMPQQDGLETTRRLKTRYPQVKIVMLTMDASDDLLFTALKNGASGYLLKSLPAPQFLEMLVSVMRGETVLSPTLATRVLTTLAQEEESSAPAAPAPPEEPLLTPRQQEVLTLVAQGLSNREIAHQLHISNNTVKYHVGQIMERLHLQTRHQLIRYQLDSQQKE
jgi:two-component system NarL family response regulator